MGGRAPKSSAATTLKRVAREIERGWPPGLTLLTGEDLYHLEHAERTLIDALVPRATSDFAVTVFGDARVDVSTVVAAARSVGMFAERRVVHVRDVTALEGEPDALVAYAEDPPASSHLIVRAPVLDKRRKLHQALARAGRTLEFEATGPGGAAALAQDVVALARDKGLQIERRAAMLLFEISGGDFYRVDAELEKARAWLGAGAGSKVTPEVLRQVAVGSGALSGWEVATALLQRERGAALEALDRLLEAGDDPLRLLGGLAYRARSMLRARSLMERGIAPAKAIAAARIWGVPPGLAAKGVSRYTVGEVLRFPALLLEADRTLKSRAVPPRAVLGAMLEQMMPDAEGLARGRS
jgi:DNA polymerase-3 subunit delta